MFKWQIFFTKIGDGQTLYQEKILKFGVGIGDGDDGGDDGYDIDDDGDDIVVDDDDDLGSTTAGKSSKAVVLMALIRAPAATQKNFHKFPDSWCRSCHSHWRPE